MLAAFNARLLEALMIWMIPIALLLFIVLAWNRNYREGWLILGALAVPVLTHIILERAILWFELYEALPKGYGLGFLFSGGMYLGAVAVAAVVGGLLQSIRASRD